MYQPCRSNGPLTVYQQHVCKLASLQQFECPKEAILADLAQEIQAWQDEGNHVILLTNFNEDITDPSIHCWATNLGLVEVITWLHHVTPPPTYQCGQKPIDSIFITPQLLPLAAGGYCGFSDAIPSDHRAIWLDLHLLEICLMHQLAHTKPSA